MDGVLVTETLDFDRGRDVTVYVPAAPATAVVYAGDGQLIAPWGADVNATMVVGVHRLVDEEARLHEYSPNFDPSRFAAHERFFVEDVRAWVRDRFRVDLPASRTAVCGVSASGELAIALGLRRPDVYGTVFCASPGGGYQPPGDMAELLPRAYFVGGTEEPWFAANARRWADALAAAGADTVMVERPGSHGDPFWRREFAAMTEWAFGDGTP